MLEQIKKFAQDNYEEMLETLKELCHIPAPSHHEEKRAEYCKAWFEKIGAKGAYVDDALNAIFPLNCEGSNEITVFAAHIDTVFPDMEPMPYYDDGEKIHCPGVSDDTASVVVLLEMAKYFVENDIKPEKGILFVCNSCEEGLGNLKGSRQLFKDYEGRIKQFVTFDSQLHLLSDRCVGSHRYEVEISTEGGHSWGNFGRKNAIAELSKLIAGIYSIEMPEKEGARASYNIGTIEGGTSVNTISQNAKMLCEYRSDDADCLGYMQKKFEELFEKTKAQEGVELKVTLLGERPCGRIAMEKIEPLKKVAESILAEYVDRELMYESSSTDCNIPFSLGVPALCIGTNNHFGVHTREEWVEKASLIPGLEVAIRVGLGII